MAQVPKSLQSAKYLLSRAARIRINPRAKLGHRNYLEGRKSGLEEALRLLATVEVIEPANRKKVAS